MKRANSLVKRGRKEKRIVRQGDGIKRCTFHCSLSYRNCEVSIRRRRIIDTTASI